MRDAAFSPDSRYIATASEDRTVRVWETATRRTLMELRGHNAPVTSVAFSDDGKFIVTGSANCQVMLYRWDLGGSLSELVALANRQLARIHID